MCAFIMLYLLFYARLLVLCPPIVSVLDNSGHGNRRSYQGQEVMMEGIECVRTNIKGGEYGTGIQGKICERY